MTRKEELAELLEVNMDKLTMSEYNDNIFSLADGEEYLILTDSEAAEIAGGEIIDSLWAFNAEYIIEMCGLDNDDNVIISLEKMTSSACEGANNFLYSLIKHTCGMNEFISDAIEADGRGCFISNYDGEEQETENYFVYRLN